MYSPNEETEILRGIDEIIYTLKKIPLPELAFFLVKEEPKLTEELVNAINFQNSLKDLKNARI